MIFYGVSNENQSYSLLFKAGIGSRMNETDKTLYVMYIFFHKTFDCTSRFMSIPLLEQEQNKKHRIYSNTCIERNIMLIAIKIMSD